MSVRQIAITTSPVSTPVDLAMNCRRKDDKLILAMDKYSKKLLTNGDQIFERWDNIIVTESGYHYALFTDELKKV